MTRKQNVWPTAKEIHQQATYKLEIRKLNKRKNVNIYKLF